MVQNIRKIILFIFFIIAFFEYYSQEVRKIDIIKANSMEFSEKVGEGAKRLIGDVIFRHEDMYMFCDSAYFFDDINTAIAYNNVRIRQGDSILMIAKYMEYEGNERIARMRDSVVLKHNKSYLVTDSLDYDRNQDMAYYFGGGRIFDADNRLFSKRGYYYTQFKDYYAVDSVILRNPQYVINTDTMRYNTDYEIAYFYGATDIVSDSNFIYCENGYYNTNNDEAAFSQNAWIRSGSNYLMGDSLYYDRKIRFGEGFNNVFIIDTVENIIATGDYGYFYEEPENALLTKRAQVIYVNEGDSIYIHSDTILLTVDTLNYRLMRAFRKVQIFNDDIQGRCDSLTFYSFDSIAHMYYDPVIWAEGNKQITADHISVYFENEEPKTFYLKHNVYAIEQIDSVHYNQAKCDNIEGHFDNSELYKIDMYKNSKTIYYLIDDEVDEIVALNRLYCVDMTFHMKDNQIENLWFYGNPDGEMIPIEQVNNDKLFLENFRWLDEIRPKTKEDIFIWRDIGIK
ncbi:MAG: hypothetical protein LBQ22_05375 [Bacteroidales bacterium]|jgi:lipopolysaccharide assembly outer membrane protein LptD (OstA)|nr:hypothetical protein [Bacteroidales bacterium]